ncbi:hypothetical protein NDU88_005441, partial [Pleurodeles waltl]
GVWGGASEPSEQRSRFTPRASAVKLCSAVFSRFSDRLKLGCRRGERANNCSTGQHKHPRQPPKTRLPRDQYCWAEIPTARKRKATGRLP